MKIYEELVARGLIAQVTDESEIRELVNNGKADKSFSFILQVPGFNYLLHNFFCRIVEIVTMTVVAVAKWQGIFITVYLYQLFCICHLRSSNQEFIIL